MEITQNYQEIQQRIQQACKRSNRKDSEIHIVAVTKSVSLERTKEALHAGLINLGENRPEGLLLKTEHIQSDAKWHYIGSLQTRKVKQVIDTIDFLHSLDRLSLAEEIQKRANKPIDCFVQVNVSGEEAKHGIELDLLEDFILSLQPFDKIKVIGLMTMAPNTEDEQVLRSVFSKLKSAQQKIAEAQFDFAPCTELSMGMSNDFEIAIEEGATFVRIGTALVGDERGDKS
ncbi:MAG: YggS family pyridoxal phosphate-dependent enzyme [Firmicutes bacterium]|nr:YggS family pyridoxal phosphate-dependent enzyme [Bacillota bacterium]